MIDDRRVEELVEVALKDLRAKLEALGCPSDAIGLSLFVASEEPAYVGQFSRFDGDLRLIGMWGPEWPFQLTRDILDEPTELFEDAGEEPVH